MSPLLCVPVLAVAEGVQGPTCGGERKGAGNPFTSCYEIKSFWFSSCSCPLLFHPCSPNPCLPHGLILPKPSPALQPQPQLLAPAPPFLLNNGRFDLILQLPHRGGGLVLGAPDRGRGKGGDEALLLPQVPPSHPTSAIPPCPPGPLAAPPAAPGQGWGAGAGEGCEQSPACLSFPAAPGWPCYVPASPQLCLPALWPPCRSQDTGIFAPSAQDKERKGSPERPLGTTPLPLRGQGPPWGHISPCWPWGAVGKPRQGGYGGMGAPRAPSRLSPRCRRYL